MGYNLKVNEKDAKVLIPEQKIVSGIMEGIVRGSSVLGLMKRLPDATSDTAVINMVDALPHVGWVDETVNNGRKQNTSVAWKNVKLHMAELAIIIPIKQNVLDDAEYDIFGQVEPLLVESAYQNIDEAILFGKNRPALWREGLIPSIINAGKNVAPSTLNTFEQISDAMTYVEQSGYDPNGIIGGVNLKGEFRKGLRDTTGQPLANSEVTELPRSYARNGSWDEDVAKFVVGDFSQAVYSIRKDFTFEVFDTGVISDDDGKVVINLMTEDMVALRFTMRMTWGVPNPVNISDENNATRFPFALVEPTLSPTTYNVVFTVTDSGSDPVSGAKITFGEQYKETNVSGQATFKSLGNSKYLYKVEKEGSNTVFGEKAVTTSNTTVAVENF